MSTTENFWICRSFLFEFTVNSIVLGHGSRYFGIQLLWILVNLKQTFDLVSLTISSILFFFHSIVALYKIFFQRRRGSFNVFQLLCFLISYQFGNFVMTWKYRIKSSEWNYLFFYWIFQTTSFWCYFFWCTTFCILCTEQSPIFDQYVCDILVSIFCRCIQYL